MAARPIPLRQDRTAVAQGVSAEQPRRRRREVDATAIGTPLGAAFVGLLMAQGHTALAAAVRADLSSDSSTLARLFDRMGGQGQGAMHGGAGAIGHGGVPAAAGSILDPGGSLSGMAGGSFMGAAGAMKLAGGSGGDTLGRGVDFGMDGSITTNVTFAGMPSNEVAPVEVDDSDRGGEGLGPVGEHVQGGSGNDVIIGTDDDDTLKGGDGDDYIDGRGGDDDLDGENGDDTVLGGSGDDVIQGGAGNDLVDGQAGDDTVDGGTGEDTVKGGDGDDIVSGGAGDDVVSGGNGDDVATGNGGNDRILVDSIHDVAVENQEGYDHGGIDTIGIGDGYAASLKATLPSLSPDGLATFVMGDQVGVTLPDGFNPFVQSIHPAFENLDLLGNSAFDVFGSETGNRINGNAGDNLIAAQGGDDWVYGGGGRDVIWGGDGADSLYGASGADHLMGGAGEDRLYGGDGDDLIDGGAGADLLYGAAGNDVYRFGLSEAKPDRVFDLAGSNALEIKDAAPADIKAIIAGNDLYVQVDGKDVAIIDSYVGHESVWSGIDTSAGLKSIASLLTTGTVTLDPTLPQPRPDLIGTDANDLLAAPTGAGHHLQGMGGDDILTGGSGADRLEGGMGTDTLKGGAGADTYVLHAGDSGIDRIVDHAGKSTIEVTGVDFKDLSHWMNGKDLWIGVDTTPLGVVEEWQTNHQDWSIKVGDKTVAVDDLFAS